MIEIILLHATVFYSVLFCCHGNVAGTCFYLRVAQEYMRLTRMSLAEVVLEGDCIFNVRGNLFQSRSIDIPRFLVIFLRVSRRVQT